MVKRSNDKIWIIAALLGGVVVLAVTIGFVGQGNVRHVTIFWTEKVEQTVIFEEIDGKSQIKAIKGVLGDANPTLLSRTSFAYILTVINNGTTFHRLYIDGFNVQTELLEPGQQDTITIYPDKEGEFTYYDKRQHLIPLGKIKIVSVVPSDEFQGIWKDLI
ncbi:MAG: cupredoxin domain-containing protein [Nitrosopumilus sp.]|nr:cupredoxin domain-containing protein [Nitrosopumilus sp.]MDH3735814.1 cupredoxin domain-containing protein [Nitrosopumilus sp.]MDH3833146.1 cupredoxin domain-containing protein [Nitrosopumilus sp.]